MITRSTEMVVREIPIARILAIRNSRPVGSVKDLMLSIQQKGLLQPIVVRQTQGRYRVIAGFRRLSACKRLGWEKIPAAIWPDPPGQELVLQLIENVQRRDYSDLELALALERMRVEEGLSHPAIGKRIGKPGDWVSRRFAYLAIVRELQAAGVDDGTLKRIPLSFVRKLYPLSTESKVEMVGRILDEDLRQIQVARIVKTEYPRVNETSSQLGRRKALEKRFAERAICCPPNAIAPEYVGDRFSILIQGEVLRLLFTSERQFKEILELLKAHGGEVL